VREKPYEVAHVSHICMHPIERSVNIHADVFACDFFCMRFLWTDVGGNAGDNTVGYVGRSLLFFQPASTIARQ
jgi:hypothetical protein